MHGIHRMRYATCSFHERQLRGVRFLHQNHPQQYDKNTSGKPAPLRLRFVVF